MWGVVFGDGGWWAKRVVLLFPFLVLLPISCGQDRVSHGFCRGEERGGKGFFWGGVTLGISLLDEAPAGIHRLECLARIYVRLTVLQRYMSIHS